ncbi:hypothetical protein F5Y18DRAFT_424152 [Xylariaceae sp. FL1019]|nr:hypothetical protein F5Y18DRAFT_424152 [Xylariaceae sp. FL1019]
MSALSEVGRSLLESGSFSDCVLVCTGQEYNVHQAYVCTQSPVIAAAFNSSMKEGTSKRLEVAFDNETLYRMLQYMYTRDYSHLDIFHHFIADTQVNNDHEVDATMSKTLQVSSLRTGTGEFTKALLQHARVSIAADYYMVPGLARRAAEKLCTLLEHPGCSADAVFNLVEEVIGQVGDESFYDLLIRHISLNLPALAPRLFGDNGIANELASDVLLQGLNIFRPAVYSNASMEVLRANNTSVIQSLKARDHQIIEAHHRFLRSSWNLKNVSKILTSAERCLRTDCNQQFGCFIEDLSGDDECATYAVVCKGCGTAHSYDEPIKKDESNSH